MIKLLLWGLFFAAIATTANAQTNRISWEYNYEHFGIENGLPSSESYQVYQDKSGMLWVLTDRGVVRYDGFTFHHYTVENGLCDNINFRMFEDFNGAVWFMGYNGMLSVFRDGKMQPYKFNHVFTKETRPGQNAYISFYVERDNSIVYAKYSDRNSFRVTKEGKVQHLPKTVGDNSHFLECGDELLCTQTKPVAEVSNIFFVRNQKTIFAGKLYVRDATRAKKHKGFYFIMTEQKLYLNDGEQNKLLLGNSGIISLDSDEEFVYVGFYKGGMKKYRFDPKSKELVFIQHYLPKYSVTSAYKDLNQTLWITTLESGMFSISDEAFRQLAINENILSEEVRFINGNRNKIIITHYIGKWQQLYAPYLCKDVGKITRRFNLVAVNDGFVFQKGFVDWSDWKDVDATYPLNPSYTNGSWIIGTDYHATKMIETNRKLKYLVDLKAAKKYDLSKAYVWYYIMDRQKAFIVYDTGLNVFDIKNSKTHGRYRSVLKQAIRKLKYNKLWGLIAVSNTEGLFKIDMQKEKASRIAQNLEMGNQILNIFLDEKNQLWVVSDKGLFLLVNKNGKAIVSSYLNKNLLSSSEIMDLYAYKDIAYLATKFGVQKIDFQKVKKERKVFPLALFSIHGFADNDELSCKKIYPAKVDLIKISLSNKNLSKKFVYRYRFGKDKTWIKSEKGEIILNNPANGIYDLEVSYLDTFNHWSKPKVLFGFEVEKIIFLRWYFILLYAIMLIILFYIILKLSIQSVNKKNFMLNRMMELERMALSAQMNPHFIFNSLNSIHSFLLYEENENAEKYLLRFARLIRQTLANSRESYITIGEEYETLNNYLLLEKMRFKNMFNFRIECDYNKLPLQPCIPPMLIQPYVENAILHGLVKRPNDGELLLRFYMEDELLKILIQDNGIGCLASKKEKKDSKHKSYGTQITEERLKSLQGKNSAYDVSIGDADSSDLEFPGTRVLLTIPINVN
ncbi:sensor histidine kinase [Fluviicola sp.]|uniref:sensor histidine kinase n=1 Tax=Fluviicola sp. TaxID=1917219 RepID=UPI003D26A2B1